MTFLQNFIIDHKANNYPTVPASKNYLKLFVRESAKTIEDLFKNFYISLGTTTSGIFLVKSQGFAASVPFNVIEMV